MGKILSVGTRRGSAHIGPERQLLPTTSSRSTRHVHLPFYPCHYQFDDKINLADFQWKPCANTMPFLHAATTARRGGMLRDKYGMFFHRGLFPVIAGKRGSNSGSDKIERMPADGFNTFAVNIRQVLDRKFKS